MNYYWKENGEDCLPKEAQKYLKDHNNKVEEVGVFKEKLMGRVKGVTNVAQLKKMFPELESYMPEDTEPTKDLPVCSNLMADAVKLGWPKGKQPQGAAA